MKALFLGTYALTWFSGPQGTALVKSSPVWLHWSAAKGSGLDGMTVAYQVPVNNQV